MFKLGKKLVAVVIAVIEVLLLIRFGLKFFGVDDQASLVNWVYSTTQVLLDPFNWAFPAASVRGEQALEFTTLFALFAYAFLGYILQESLDFLLKHQRRERTIFAEK